MRASLQQQWQTPRVTVERTDTGEATICGQQVTLLVYDGADEGGVSTRHVVSGWFDLDGKLTRLEIYGPIEDWDQAQVDAFVRSIH